MLTRYRSNLVGVLLAFPCICPAMAGSEVSSVSADAYFVENRGQWPDWVRFAGRVGGVDVGLADRELVFARPESGVGGSVRLEFLDADAASPPSGVGTDSAIFSYFRGRDASRWIQGTRGFPRVRYEEVWPGVNLVLRESDGRLKYDLEVAAGVGTNQILFRARGGTLQMEADGSLRLGEGPDALVQVPAATWQILADGARQAIPCRFDLREDGVFGFELEGRDPTCAVVIDPGIVWSTYAGSTTNPAGIGDLGSAVAVGPDGDVYVTGFASGPDFPLSAGAFHQGDPFGRDIFVARFRARDGGLVFSSILGGSHIQDFSTGIAVDARGRPTISGRTDSVDFPITPGAWDTSKDALSTSAFCLRLSQDGACLEYSTYLEGAIDGTDANGVAVAEDGSAIVVGLTSDENYPTTRTSFGPSMDLGSPTPGADGFVTKLSRNGSGITWSGFVGGTGGEWIHDVCLDPSGDIWVVGRTTSTDLPTTPQALLPNKPGTASVHPSFVARIRGDGSAIEAMSYLGGAMGDTLALAVAPDHSGGVVLGGWTRSVDFPVTPNAFQPQLQQGVNFWPDAFIARLDSGLTTLIYSTYYGSSFNDEVHGIAADQAGNITFTGFTRGFDIPITPDAIDPSYGGFSDAFVARVAPDGSLAFSTFLGGPASDEAKDLAVGPSGTVAIVGTVFGPGYPTTPGAFDPTFNGGQSDAFVTRLHFDPLADGSTSSSGPPSYGGVHSTGLGAGAPRR